MHASYGRTYILIYYILSRTAVHPGRLRDFSDRGGGLHGLQRPPGRAQLAALRESHGHSQSIPAGHHIRGQRAAALRHRQHGMPRQI